RTRNRINDKGRIAQEDLDFNVINYTKIAEEQKRLRAERDQEKMEKLRKFIHFGNSDDETDKADESDDEQEIKEEDFNDKINKNR
ncbi:MAG: hypothetical protein IIZ23_02670, partial [Ruminococcus sp.]|nr:hypothetical protein [Ruminococcus sp.]